MSYAANRCLFCNKTIFTDDLWKHCDQEHAALSGLEFNQSGNRYTFSRFVETFPSCEYEFTEADMRMEVPGKPDDLLFTLGVSHDVVTHAAHYNIGDGGAFSETEFSICLDSLSKLGGTAFRLNRERFIASLVRFLLVNDASPLLDDKGSVVLVSEASMSESAFSGGVTTIEVTWERVLATWMEALGSRARQATFRRAARTLSLVMMDFVNTAQCVADLKKKGTPLSAKFGIPAEYYYTAVSFFPYMKSSSRMTKDERRFNDFRVRHTVVEPSRVDPHDNRPALGSPEAEQSVGSKHYGALNDRLHESRPSLSTNRDVALSSDASSFRSGGVMFNS